MELVTVCVLGTRSILVIVIMFPSAATMITASTLIGRPRDRDDSSRARELLLV